MRFRDPIAHDAVMPHDYSDSRSRMPVFMFGAPINTIANIAGII